MPPLSLPSTHILAKTEKDDVDDEDGEDLDDSSNNIMHGIFGVRSNPCLFLPLSLFQCMLS